MNLGIGDPGAQVDHLVVAAATLADGVTWCEDTLGITPGPGGEHDVMGTHNRLFAISSEAFPLCFLELIALNPAAPPATRERWFGLDHLDLTRGPRLVNVVARTHRLNARRAALESCGLRPGEVVQVSRETPSGLLRWRILVRHDGVLDAAGALPTLMQWDDLRRHPAKHLPADDVTLRRVQLGGLATDAQQALALASVHHAETPPAAAIVVELDTPRGPVTITSDSPIC